VAATNSRQGARLPRRAAGVVQRQVLRLRVRCRRRRLDAELAAGIDPASEPALALRALQLLGLRNRRRLAACLRRLVDECDRAPARSLSSAIPVPRDQVAEARPTLVFMAELLCSADRLQPRGVAMLTQLLTDGGSVLYVRGARGVLQLRLQTILQCLVGRGQAFPEAPVLAPVSSDGGPVGQR
jgi:hypothetical protein